MIIEYLKYYNYKKLSLIAFFALMVLFATAQDVFAVVVTEEQQIGGVEYGAGLSGFLSSLYTWGVGIVGVLAFAQLVRGGIMYMVSGAVDTKNAAKGIITDAFIGLTLALTSYLILNFVNPQISQVQEVELEKVEMLEYKETPTSTPQVLQETNATQCLGYGELQGYIDNNYTCDTAQMECESGKSAYICIAPSSVLSCSIANADSPNCVGTEAQENMQFYAPTYTPGDSYKIGGDQCPQNYYGADYRYGDIPVGCVLIKYTPAPETYTETTYDESVKNDYQAQGYICTSKTVWASKTLYTCTITRQ